MYRNAHFGRDGHIAEILGQGGTLMPDLSLQEISCVSAEDLRTSISPKNLRYLNFGITSFNFRLFGINKNYLLIIKKFITRFNHNF